MKYAKDHQASYPYIGSGGFDIDLIIGGIYNFHEKSKRNQSRKKKMPKTLIQLITSVFFFFCIVFFFFSSIEMQVVKNGSMPFNQVKNNK